GNLVYQDFTKGAWPMNGFPQSSLVIILQKTHNLFFVFRWSLTESGCMLRPIHNPQLFRSARSPIDLLGVAAGNRCVSCAADQKHRKGARRQGLVWRYVVGIESASFCECFHCENRRGTKKRLAENWTEMQSRVVVAYFAQVGEWVFRDHAFDARFDGG